MIDITVNELNKYYGSNHVLKGLSFEIYSGERVGLLGKNGSGKTTLFKVITGDEYYESGNISKASGKKIEMLAQIPMFGENDTTEDILRSSFAEAADVFKAMKKIEGDANPATLAKYGRLMDEYERLGGYDIETRLDIVCNGMNIGEVMKKSPFNLLSGGEKARVNLARILLRECDIILLDEPTNHLDLASLEWLEKFLQEFAGTIVVVSHDRIFLDRVVTRIIEIDDGKANFYSGNYSFYLEERVRRYLTQSEQYKQQQKKINQLEVAIKRQRVWAQINPSNTGLAKRALAMEKRIEQMDKVEKPVTARKLNAGFDSGGYASKEIVSFDSVSKSYGAKSILNKLNLKICRNDRIALIGANGSGKSTLLKMLMGEEQYDKGDIKISPNIKTAYMPQIITFDDKDATILDTLRFEMGIPEEKARSILAKFHFMANDVLKRVEVLSGGEKSRLKLCLMMQKNINFLLLDEPTNHLDIASREWIEQALDDFEGTMLFVSHDRYFLSKFTDKIWSMKDGLITQYDCGFDEYMEMLRKGTTLREQPIKKKTKNIQPQKLEIKIKQPKPIKSSSRNSITGSSKNSSVGSINVSIEDQILKAESELSKVEAEIKLNLSRANSIKMNDLYKKKDSLAERIDNLYNEWVYRR